MSLLWMFMNKYFHSLVFLVNKLWIILCKYANGEGTSHSFSLGTMLWKIALYLVFIYGTDFYCHFFLWDFFWWGHKRMMSNIGTILASLLFLACKRWLWVTWFKKVLYRVSNPGFMDQYCNLQQPKHLIHSNVISWGSKISIFMFHIIYDQPL